MTMDLFNTSNDHLDFPIVVWEKLQLFAKLYGWEPIGTVDIEDRLSIAEGRPWDSNYFTNDGQFVTPEDADAFADALEKALVDIPDFTIIAKPSVIKIKDVRLQDLNSHPRLRVMISAFIDAGQGEATIINPHLTPFEIFGGRKKVIVREFIAFCRKGGFEIW